MSLATLFTKTASKLPHFYKRRLNQVGFVIAVVSLILQISLLLIRTDIGVSNPEINMFVLWNFTLFQVKIMLIHSKILLFKVKTYDYIFYVGRDYILSIYCLASPNL